MSQKCALSFKKDTQGFCNTIVNGKLRVKQTARIEKTLAVENNLQVYNDANIGDTVNTCNITIKNQLIYSEPELINESGKTLSQLKTLSFINTSGTGILEDGCCNGLYKQIVKINDGTTASEWETLSDINGNVNVIAFDEFNNDEGPYIGGNFTSVNGNTALKYLAKYDVGSSSWTSVKSGGDNVNNNIRTIAFGPSGDGPYIGGDFGEVDSDTTLKKLAYYNGSSWTSVKSGGDNITGGNIYKIAFNPQNHIGPYICGEFTSVDSNSILKYISYYNGSSWTSVKSGGDGIIFTLPPPNQPTKRVNTIYFSPDGIGPYIGGYFTEVDGNNNLNFIAKYNGSNWGPIKSGGDFNNPLVNVYNVNEILSYNNIIYISGYFSNNPRYLRKYNISTDDWTSVKTGGDNISGSFSEFIYSIKIDKNGEGPYIGGGFISVDGDSTLSYLAKYDSSSDSWTSVKSGGDNIDARVNTVAFSPSGTGPYIGGDFTEVGGETANAKFSYYRETGAQYVLTYNTTETLTLTNKGDEATLVYNTTPTNSWIKLT